MSRDNRQSIARARKVKAVEEAEPDQPDVLEDFNEFYMRHKYGDSYRETFDELKEHIPVDIIRGPLYHVMMGIPEFEVIHLTGAENVIRIRDPVDASRPQLSIGMKDVDEVSIWISPPQPKGFKTMGPGMDCDVNTGTMRYHHDLDEFNSPSELVAAMEEARADGAYEGVDFYCLLLMLQYARRLARIVEQEQHTGLARIQEFFADVPEERVGETPDGSDAED